MKPTWVNRKLKKYKSWLALGTYEYEKGERYFVLTDSGKKSNARLVFESYQAAKAEGWYKT